MGQTTTGYFTGPTMTMVGLTFAASGLHPSQA